MSAPLVMRDIVSRAGRTRASDQQKLNWSTSMVGVAGFVTPGARQVSRAAGKERRPARKAVRDPVSHAHGDAHGDAHGGAHGRSPSTRWIPGTSREGQRASGSVAVSMPTSAQEIDHSPRDPRRSPPTPSATIGRPDPTCHHRAEGLPHQLVPDAERPGNTNSHPVAERARDPRRPRRESQPGRAGTRGTASTQSHLRRTGSVPAPVAIREIVSTAPAGSEV